MSDALSNDRDRDAGNSGKRPDQSGEDDILLIDILIALAKHKKLLLGLPTVAIGLAFIYSVSLPNIYTASAKILPVQYSQSSPASLLTHLGDASTQIATSSKTPLIKQNPSRPDGLLEQLGNAAALMGAMGGYSNVRNELVIGVLKSRSVADNLVQRFGLMKVYGVTRSSDARDRLEGDTKILTGKDGLITIDVEHSDAQFAAELANGYIDELMKLSHLLVVSQAGKRRQFFEQQLVQAKANLAKAELAARQELQPEGGANLKDKGRAKVEATARLLAQISVKEMQISAMRMFVGEDTPSMGIAKHELESIKRKFADTAEADFRPTTVKGDTPLRGLDLFHALKYSEALYELLARQYEVAKIEEAKDAPIIQVLDKATAPEKKSKPNHSLIVLISAVAALFAALLLIFLRESMSRSTDDPQSAGKWETLRRYLAWR